MQISVAENIHVVEYCCCHCLRIIGILQFMCGKTNYVNFTMIILLSTSMLIVV